MASVLPLMWVFTYKFDTIALRPLCNDLVAAEDYHDGVFGYINQVQRRLD